MPRWMFSDIHFHVDLYNGHLSQRPWLPNCQNNHRSRQRRLFIVKFHETWSVPRVVSVWFLFYWYSLIESRIKILQLTISIFLMQALPSPKKHRCCNKINFVTVTFLWRGLTIRQFNLKQYSKLFQLEFFFMSFVVRVLFLPRPSGGGLGGCTWRWELSPEQRFPFQMRHSMVFVDRQKNNQTPLKI